MPELSRLAHDGPQLIPASNVISRIQPPFGESFSQEPWLKIAWACLSPRCWFKQSGTIRLRRGKKGRLSNLTGKHLAWECTALDMRECGVSVQLFRSSVR